MTTLAGIFLVVAAVAAVLDWVAVARDDTRLEYVAKPATLVALIAVALTLDAVDPAQQAWWVAALVFSLAGDVFLMLPGRFVQGLAAFLLGHLAYIGGFLGADAVPVPPMGDGIEAEFVLLGGRTPDFVLTPMAAVLPVVLVALALGSVIVRAARRHDARLTVPVAVYLVAISAMVVLALSSGSAWAAAGALLFFASDGLIGIRNFVVRRPWMDLAVIVTYHLGQGLLVLSLVNGLPL